MSCSAVVLGNEEMGAFKADTEPVFVAVRVTQQGPLGPHDAAY